MSDNKNTVLSMATAFFVSEEYTDKEKVKDFESWLEKEGYERLKSEYSNMYSSYYIDIASKTYVKANSFASFAPIIGMQGIYFEDFKNIHYIFMKTAEKEKTWRYRPAYMTPLPMYLYFEQNLKSVHDEEIEWYFGKNPSFEQWCDDVFVAIKEHHWYKRYRPDYSKEEYLECLKDVLVHSQMENYYKKRELPSKAADEWDLITF